MEYVLEVLSSLFLYHWLELRIEVAVLVVFYQSGFTLSGELREGERGRGGERGERGERGKRWERGERGRGGGGGGKKIKKGIIYYTSSHSFNMLTLHSFFEQSEGVSIRWERCTGKGKNKGKIKL